MTTASLPVFIAGAGPVGLVAAARLVTKGIRVELFEKRDSVNRISRASTFHPPTLKILSELGFIELIHDQGLRVDSVLFKKDSEKGIKLDYLEVRQQSDFPFRVHLEQAIVGQEILAFLENNSFCALHWNSEVVAAANRKETVTVTVRSKRTGETEREGLFLLAADGAESTTRKSLGLKFAGKDYEFPALRIFVRTDLRSLSSDLESLTYRLSRSDSCSLLEMPDSWRIVFRLPKDVSEKEALSQDYQRKRLQTFFRGQANRIEIDKTDLYYSSCRVVEQNLVGRIGLIGDAAHQTNTRGGMNMNAGIHDADSISLSIVECIDRNSLDPLAVASSNRDRIVREKLIPRTDRAVRSPFEWYQSIKYISTDPGLRRNYLIESLMLDMI